MTDDRHGKNTGEGHGDLDFSIINHASGFRKKSYSMSNVSLIDKEMARFHHWRLVKM